MRQERSLEAWRDRDDPWTRCIDEEERVRGSKTKIRKGVKERMRRIDLDETQSSTCAPSEEDGRCNADTGRPATVFLSHTFFFFFSFKSYTRYTRSYTIYKVLFSLFLISCVSHPSVLVERSQPWLYSTNPRCPPTDTNGYLCQRLGNLLLYIPLYKQRVNRDHFPLSSLLLVLLWFFLHFYSTSRRTLKASFTSSSSSSS